MSESALQWAAGVEAPDRTSKFLLMRLAAYADGEEVAWALVGRLATELQASDRTIQRALRALEAAELIKNTGRFRFRNVPYYQLAVGRTVTRVSPLNGDTDVTVGDPNGDTRDTPNGDTGVTPKKEGEINSPSDEGEARARQAFDELAKAWIEVDPDKLSRPKAWPAFRAIVERGEASPDALLAAGRAYLTSEKRRGAPAMLHFWLGDGTWEGRVSAAKARADAERTRFADEKVRAAVVGAKDEAWARSWLDAAAWRNDVGQRWIVAATRIAADTLRRELGWLWPKLQATVVDPEKGATAP